MKRFIICVIISLFHIGVVYGADYDGDKKVDELDAHGGSVSSTTNVLIPDPVDTDIITTATFQELVTAVLGSTRDTGAELDALYIDDVPEAGDFGAATALDANGQLGTGAAVGDTAFTDLTAGDSYTNFGGATDDTIDELFSAIDTSWPSTSGAPTDAQYWTNQAEAGLSAEVVVNSAATLESAANLGAYASDILAATSEANFKTIVNLVIGTDVQASLAEGDFVDGDKTKLDGIETAADVTDATNVAAAGALMDSGLDNIDDTHINWGAAAGQVSADDIPDGSTNAVVTLTQESNWDTHLSSTGADHTYVDQDVTSGSTPTFTGTNFTGIPLAGLSGLSSNEVIGDIGGGVTTVPIDENLTTVGSNELAYSDAIKNYVDAAVTGWDSTIRSSAPGTPTTGNVYFADSESGGWNPLNNDDTVDYAVIYIDSSWQPYFPVGKVNGEPIVQTAAPSNPITGWIYYADANGTWDPDSEVTGTDWYAVRYNGTSYVSIRKMDGTLLMSTLKLPNGTDPDLTEESTVSNDTDGANEAGDVVLRGYDGTNQFAYSRKIKCYHIGPIPSPNDYADALRDQFCVLPNNTGMTFTITEIKGWSDTDNTTLNVEVVSDTDRSTPGTVDAIEIATDGTGVYTATETTITDPTIAHNEKVCIDFDDTDTPGSVELLICGTYDADVD